MTYENFLKIIATLQEESNTIQTLYSYKVDLIDFTDPYHKIITILFKEVYGEEGYDWLSWYCYDNDFGQKGLEAYDADKNLICYSHESLWQYLESLKK